MTPITTIEQARALVGRTFKRGGKSISIRDVSKQHRTCGVTIFTDVATVATARDWAYLSKWLSRAKEVK